MSALTAGRHRAIRSHRAPRRGRVRRLVRWVRLAAAWVAVSLGVAYAAVLAAALLLSLAVGVRWVVN